MASDPFALERFVTAQAPVWSAVQAELRAGRKQTHWMWFVFPQLAVLGRSSTARHYGLSGLDEARAYLAHPVLGSRLVACCRMLLQVPEHDAVAVFGSIDAMKLRSCMTLFAEAKPQEPAFGEVLRSYFAGEPDGLTLQALRLRWSRGSGARGRRSAQESTARLAAHQQSDDLLAVVVPAPAPMVLLLGLDALELPLGLVDAVVLLLGLDELELPLGLDEAVLPLLGLDEL